ncbi:hypothetical protein JZ751_009047 [Albula glossodonta]|uniref:Interleukin-17 receptor C/E N-terminal domain-containing protein n=1 Tax=Albula glossodonta TaxID=121402 RepID=A0A8T2P3J4_9TELE|nr:hypothetical protein JZ751_009047 [Albula glossodonta]
MSVQGTIRHHQAGLTVVGVDEQKLVQRLTGNVYTLTDEGYLAVLAGYLYGGSGSGLEAGSFWPRNWWWNGAEAAKTDSVPALFAACKRDPAIINSTVFHRVNLSTVMKCDEIQKCSLYLRVTATVQIYERLQGVSVCTVSSGMLEYCRVVTFPRKARGRLAGQRVEVQDDCVEVAPNQNVNVMLKTHPEYCDITWSQMYRVQGCGNAVLRSNVPECITGKIAYTVDEVKRELSVTVSDMLEDRDYHLRLCHRWEICSGTEAYTLLKREDSLKRATLQYSSPLPCLCIEGWSAMADAPRVQVCPFRNRTEELWSGVTFDPEREALSWEPACPVKAVVTLCQRERGNVCHDLANSSQPVGREKVTYSKVDPHPTICMKARRADVQFSIPALQCGFQCSERATISNGQYLCRVEWLLVFAITCVTLVIIAGLAGNIILTVYQRRRANRKPGSYHQFERTAVKLLHAEDGKDYTLQSSGDLEKFMLDRTLDHGQSGHYHTESWTTAPSREASLWNSTENFSPQSTAPPTGPYPQDQQASQLPYS